MAHESAEDGEWQEAKKNRKPRSEPCHSSHADEQPHTPPCARDSPASLNATTVSHDPLSHNASPASTRSQKSGASLFSDVSVTSYRNSQNSKHTQQPHTTDYSADDRSAFIRERAQRQTYRSTEVASGKLKCNACGRLFRGRSFLAQHLRDVHDGLNAPGAVRRDAARVVSTSSEKERRKQEVEEQKRSASIADVVSLASSNTSNLSSASSSAWRLSQSIEPRNAPQRHQGGGSKTQSLGVNVSGANQILKHRGKRREDGERRRRKLTSLKKAILRKRKGEYKGVDAVDQRALSTSDERNENGRSPHYATSESAASKQQQVRSGSAAKEEEDLSSETEDVGSAPQAEAIGSSRGLKASAAPFVPSIAPQQGTLSARRHLTEHADTREPRTSQQHRNEENPDKKPTKNPSKTYIGENADFAWYADQVVTREVNEKVWALLKALIHLQASMKQRNPTKAAMRKRYVLGLRECEKAVKAGKCKLLVLAPNIEEAEGERGTNAKLRVMLSSCSATATPVALALTRSKLGSAFKERKASSVAVLDTNGTETEAKAAKEEAESGRKRFKELFPEKIAELKQIFHPDNSPVPQALRKF